MSTRPKASRVTGEDLLSFLNRESSARRMHAGTAASRRSAVREVLARAWDRTGMDPLVVPFTSEDVPDLLHEFSTSVDGEFGEGTIRSYRSNFQRTVELYLDALEAPDVGEMETYRFPIRPGIAAELTLPANLTQAEAKRLAALIEALPLES